MTNKKKLEETQKKLFDSRDLIAGSIVLFIGILIGSFWLSGLAESVSKLAATLGSLATAATLVFLIYQNIELRKQQEKQQKQQSETQTKQHEMWLSQKEILTFDKYQRHQNMFETLLDNLEEKHNNQFKFMDRIALYELLFPHNSPSSCHYEINKSPNSFQCTLRDQAQMITNVVTTYELNIPPSQLIHIVSLFKNSLRVNFIGDIEIGGFSSLNGTNLDINIFEPLLTIEILCDITKRLISFSSSYNTKDAFILSHLNYDILYKIQKYIVDNESWAGELKYHHYNIAFKIAFLHLDNLSKVYDVLIDQDKKHLSLLEDLFSSQHKVKEFIEYSNNPTAYANQCLKELISLNNEQTEIDFTHEIANYRLTLEAHNN